MQNYYQFIIPRLNGGEVRRNFRHYSSLVKKGVAGFIVFGGELKTLRRYLADLQALSELPLIIASDLERGLGQQVKGGTLFPPAMALASAIKSSQRSAVSNKDLRILRASFRAVAEEARYAGINTIFAPVLDINTNPRNPIISVRAFGEDSETVSFFGCEMIRELQAQGLAACGKHFPGHGDTEVDSHIKLPVVESSLRRLKRYELRPFQKAIEEDVKMIMLGHLNVPALDSSGIPVSISKKAVRFLREKMKFKGILTTDAMNMGGIGKFSEEKAAFMSLDAGVDILLHPTDPEKVVSYLEGKKNVFDAESLTHFRRELDRGLAGRMPGFAVHGKLSDLLADKAIRLRGDFWIKGDLFLVILNDDEQSKGIVLARTLKEKIPSVKIRIIRERLEIEKIKISDNAFVAAAIFSETKGWKGGASSWLCRQIACLQGRTDLFVSFGSPYLLDNINVSTIFAYWDSESAQRAVARIITKKTTGTIP